MDKKLLYMLSKDPYKSVRKTPRPQKPRNTREEIRSTSKVPKRTTIKIIARPRFTAHTLISKRQRQEPVLLPESKHDQCSESKGKENQRVPPPALTLTPRKALGRKFGGLQK